eukprot:8625304-Alexandrium_andersonii.AAC.1
MPLAASLGGLGPRTPTPRLAPPARWSRAARAVTSAFGQSESTGKRWPAPKGHQLRDKTAFSACSVLQAL